jgi:hypothetical protein
MCSPPAQPDRLEELVSALRLGPDPDAASEALFAYLFGRDVDLTPLIDRAEAGLLAPRGTGCDPTDRLRDRVRWQRVLGVLQDVARARKDAKSTTPSGETKL